MDVKFINVLLLGLGFMFVFTAFQTMGNIQVKLSELIQENEPLPTANERVTYSGSCISFI